jgi:glycine/D-amino acid oxidase-like deaminating enzyme
MAEVKVVIIGGGLSGISASYHLANKGITEQIVIEAGKIARGTDDMISGTNSVIIPGHSKMITITYASDYETFAKKNGKEKAKVYLELSSAGCELQKSIAKKLNPPIVRELGSIVVGAGKEFNTLKRDKDNYAKLGYDLEYLSKEDVSDIYRNNKEAFDGGFLIRPDAAINIFEYIKLLSKDVSDKGVVIAENTKVTEIKEYEDKVEIETDKKGKITAENAVIATNGFYEDKNLEGLLEKWWTFSVCYENKGINTPNSWEINDVYFYWTRQDNILMIGGEERQVRRGNCRFYAGEQEAMKELVKWINDKFPETSGKTPIANHFGVSANTKDEIPIIGKFSDKSRLCYIVGCNSVGQSTLSYGASLILHLLYPQLKMDEKQKRIAELVSPKRKTLKKWA